MTRFTLYPCSKLKDDKATNPYIRDFVAAINAYPDAKVINAPHKNPLLSILPMNKWGDVIIFNWYESIPDLKYGLLQASAAIVYLCLLKVARKKIVWILHNHVPHASKYLGLKKFLMSYIARFSDLIITHATEGLELVRNDYPSAESKAYYLDHPTKNRLDLCKRTEKQYDLLIWGHISRYKGVLEFVECVRNNHWDDLRICIVGKCASSDLYEEIQEKATNNVTLINDSPSFEALANYMDASHCVLAHYIPESVLSSGMLMDSLSYGVKVIGPNVGSFKDYASNRQLNVYTFNNLTDIYPLVLKYRKDIVQTKEYADFLDTHQWKDFIKELMKLLPRK